MKVYEEIIIDINSLTDFIDSSVANNCHFCWFGIKGGSCKFRDCRTGVYLYLNQEKECEKNESK